MRRGNIALTATLALIMAACSDKKSVPSGILPKDKMESIMWDMVLADSYASYLTKDSSHLDLKLEHLLLYEQVFRLHDVSRDKFKKSYTWYMSHPELTQELFDSLSNRGNRIRTESYSHPFIRPVTTPAPVPLPAATPATPPVTPGKSPFHPIIPPPRTQPVKRPAP